FFAAALSDEFQAMVDYNNALVGFEFAKGTIQFHDQVVIGEGPLPEAAQVRAVEHERQRSAALVLNERAAAFGPGAENHTSTCQFPGGAAPPLPRLWEKGPRLDRGDEPLPEPRVQPSGPGAPDQTPPPESRGGNSQILPPVSPDNARLGRPDFS